MAGLSPGSAFPGVTLPDLRGGRRSIAEALRAGPGLIVIGHSDCETTRLTLPYLDRIHRRRAPGSAVVAILQDDSAAATELATRLGLELPVYLEEDPYPVAEALGLTTVPTLILVDGAGVIERASEAFRRDDIEAVARRLGVPPPFFLPDDEAPALRPG